VYGNPTWSQAILAHISLNYTLNYLRLQPGLIGGIYLEKGPGYFLANNWRAAAAMSAAVSP